MALRRRAAVFPGVDVGLAVVVQLEGEEALGLETWDYRLGDVGGVGDDCRLWFGPPHVTVTCNSMTRVAELGGPV